MRRNPFIGCLIVSISFHPAIKPQTTPPIKPRPSIGPYFFVTMASGKLKTSAIKAPLVHPGMERGKLKIIKPIANLLIKEAVIAFVLFSNFIKNIGIIETTPNIKPAITPLVRFVIALFF